jgi:2-polyprenyl-6-methoxyphenol hydroxylase-like FAD-dependent oxidoreductase
MQPRETNMTDPILIAGAGPTGLTAALELSRLGIAVRIIDKREAPATTSRAIGIQARTLELMEQRGLVDEMLRLGNKGRFGSVYGGGKRVFRLDFGKVESRYDYMLFLSQAETERILREALARQGVEPEWRVEMVGVAQDALSHEASPVSVTLRHADGRLEHAKAPWLIGAEGAHSLVRTTLDLQFEGKTLDEDYALGDLHVDGDLADTDFHIFSSEHGFMGLFPMGGGHFRLIASNPPSKPSKDSAPSEEELQKIYDQRSPIPARFHDTTWTSWFRINSRMVPRLKVGRFLLGGDSAHIHSPAGAQGMNTGIQDMINLCWKLALVVKAQASPALLDTYEQDRLPVMREVLFKTENLTEVIGSENPIARTLFNHLGPWIGGAGAVQTNSTNRMAQVAIDYRDSPLSANHLHGGALKAGDRVPELTVRHRTGQGWETRRLLELLDPSAFVLLVAHGEESAARDAALGEAAVAGAAIKTVEMAPAEEPSAYLHHLGASSSVFLVRPDGYVAVAAGAHGAGQALSTFRTRWLRPETEDA